MEFSFSRALTLIAVALVKFKSPGYASESSNFCSIRCIRNSTKEVKAAVLSDIGSDIAVGIGTKVSEIENYYLIFWTDFSARKYS